MRKTIDLESVVSSCLVAFIQAGTLDLSLDELARAVGISKRMLVHYFGGREALEERAMTLLEGRLRAQFAPENFPPEASLQMVISALWEKTVEPSSKGVLLLVMDLSRRAWSGSLRAQSFYNEQQRLWADLLLKYLPQEQRVKDVLQCFQGAVIAYLVTGDTEAGKQSLIRLCASKDR